MSTPMTSCSIWNSSAVIKAVSPCGYLIEGFGPFYGDFQTGPENHAGSLEVGIRWKRQRRELLPKIEGAKESRVYNF